MIRITVILPLIALFMTTVAAERARLEGCIVDLAELAAENPKQE